jgi:hypothetical protein
VKLTNLKHAGGGEADSGDVTHEFWEIARRELVEEGANPDPDPERYQKGIPEGNVQ